MSIAVVKPKEVWTSQPQTLVDIDWNNPITRDLRFAWNGAQQFDAVRKRFSSTRNLLKASEKGSGVSLVAGGTITPHVAGTSTAKSVVVITNMVDFNSAQNTILRHGSPNGWGLSYGTASGLRWTHFGVADYNLGSLASTERRPQVVGISATPGSTVSAYYDGAFKTSVAIGTLNATSTTDVIINLAPLTASTQAITSFAAYWDRALTAGEHASMAANPWQIFRNTQAHIFIPVTGVGPTYTLTASSGGFTLTGVANSLLAARLLSSSTGSFSLTGNAASLLYNRALVAEVGTFSLTGNSVNLLFNRVLQGNTGSFTLTGNAANLVYTPAGVTYTLTAERGTFNLDGQIASLLANRVLSAEVGDFNLVGNNTGLYVVIPGSGPVLYLDLISKKVMLLQRLN